MSSLLREQEVKIAFINWLFEKGMLDDATIINEMVVANWSRRADLAIANGHLQAFEIKSDFDSLKRLDGQLETFTSRFEKVTVVCAPKFTYEVTKKVASDVGIIEYSNTNKGIKFKIIQRGRISVLSNKKFYINYLLKKELQLLIVEHSKQLLFESGRESLEHIAAQLPLSKIRSFVLNAIKKRYQETSTVFLNSLIKNKLSSPQDLNLLSRSKLKKEQLALSDTENKKQISSNDVFTVDIENLMMKYGEVGSAKPIEVLKRVKK